MKKIIFFYSFVSLFLIIACSKKDVEISPKIENSSQNTKDVKSLRNVSVQVNVWNGMLEFNSYSDFNNLKENLEQNCKYYTENYQEANKHLSEEEYNLKAIADGFLEEQPLILFENNYQGFTSLRKVNNQIENSWLAQGAVSDLNILFENHLFDEVEETLLNQFAEVKIGNTIVKYMQNGDIVNITNGDLNTLLGIRNGVAYDNLPNVKVIRSTENIERTYCLGKQTSYKKETKSNKDRRIVCLGKYRNTIAWDCVYIYNPNTGQWDQQCFFVQTGKKFKQKLKSFRLLYRVFGSPQWVRWRTNLEISNSGNFYYPENCNNPDFSQRRKELNRVSKLTDEFRIPIPYTSIGYDEFYLYFRADNLEHSFFL